jgi:hypothetical protein
VGYEAVGKLVFPVEHANHFVFLNYEQGGGCNRGRRRHANGLARKAPFSQKITCSTRKSGTVCWAALVKKYIGGRTSGFLFETSGGLPMSPRNIARDSLHPILKKIGRESAGFHTFRRFRESILQMSEARTLLIDFWMGYANREMSGRYGKQLLDNIQWRRDCAAKVGLGFTLPNEEEQPLMDKSGQVLKDERRDVIAA